MKLSRAEIKAAGGPAYEALLLREREARALFRKRRPGRMRELRREWDEKYGKRLSLKAALCMRARKRASDRGMEGTIRASDLVWPTHCPVLGIELDYSTPRGSRTPNAPNLPSLDRWDNTKGYIPGNVFVISLRANAIKNNATYNEILKVAAYLARHPSEVGHG